jgi:hypothetical protein
MEFDRLDSDGSIRPEADLANLQPEYQGVPDMAADLLAAEFGSRLHSAYGSIARGNAVLARARETLGTSTDPEAIRRACRMAARRMVQVAFAVVMAREGVWATVLEEQAAAVGAVFPQWAAAARRAAEQGRRPVADAGIVRELLDTFGRWAEDALDQALSEHSER